MKFNAFRTCPGGAEDVSGQMAWLICICAMAPEFSSRSGARVEIAGFSKSEMILLILSRNDCVLCLILQKLWNNIASSATAKLGWDALIYCRRGQLLGLANKRSFTGTDLIGQIGGRLYMRPSLSYLFYLAAHR